MSEPKRTTNVAVMIAGAIAVLAVIVWVTLWLAPSPEDETTQASDSRPSSPGPTAAPSVATSAPQQGPGATLQIDEARILGTQKSQAKTAPLDTPKAESKAPQFDPPKPIAPAPPSEASKVAAKPPPAKAAATDAAVAALPGRYVGTYGSDSTGFTLEITSATASGVAGVATLGGAGCRGRYPVEGSVRAQKLQMRAPRKGGPAGDCPLAFTLGIEGHKLVGETDVGETIVLRR